MEEETAVRRSELCRLRKREKERIPRPYVKGIAFQPRVFFVFVASYAWHKVHVSLGGGRERKWTAVGKRDCKTNRVLTRDEEPTAAAAGSVECKKGSLQAGLSTFPR